MQLSLCLWLAKGYGSKQPAQLQRLRVARTVDAFILSSDQTADAQSRSTPFDIRTYENKFSHDDTCLLGFRPQVKPKPGYLATEIT